MSDFIKENVLDLDMADYKNSSYEDYPISSQNYIEGIEYSCVQGHKKSVPQILPYVGSYNSVNKQANLTAIIVFVCPICKAAVQNSRIKKVEVTKEGGRVSPSNRYPSKRKRAWLV